MSAALAIQTLRVGAASFSNARGVHSPLESSPVLSSLGSRPIPGVEACPRESGTVLFGLGADDLSG